MKFRKFLSVLLTAAIAVTSFLFCHAEEDTTVKEEKDSITMPYSDIFCCVVDGVKSAVTEKLEKDGRKYLSVKPDTESEVYLDNTVTKSIKLDAWSLDRYNIDLSEYRFITVEYIYTSAKPYDRRLQMDVLKSKSLLKTYKVPSEQDIEAGKTSLAVFTVPEVEYVSQDYRLLGQLHFYPFGTYNVCQLDPNDEILIGDITFSKNDPLSDIDYTVSIGSSEYRVKRFSDFVLPEPEIIEGQRFVGYVPGSNPAILYAPGDSINIAQDMTFRPYYLPTESARTAKSLITTNFIREFNAVTDGRDTGFADASGEFLTVRPNPDSSFTSGFNIDGWEYGRLGVIPGYHKYMYVLYRAENIGNGVTPTVSIMKSNYFSSAYTVNAERSAVCGKWDFLEFDIAGLGEKVLPDAEDAVVKQIHFYPFGNVNPHSLSGDMTMELDAILFSHEKLSPVLHDRLLRGYGDDSFKPSGNITRAECATLVYRLCGSPDTGLLASGYSDAAPDSWYADAVKYVSSCGISGSDGELFRPDGLCLRWEFADMISKCVLGGKSGGDGKIFSDVSSDDPFFDSVKNCSSLGIIGGYGDGTFRPFADITRAEAAKMILAARRVNENIEEDPLPSLRIYADVDDTHWCCADITELSLRHILNGNRIVYADFDTSSGYSGGIAESLLVKGDARKAEVDAEFERRKNEILNSKTEVTYTGRAYYVANDGDDANDGTSEKTPWKSIDKVNSFKLMPGDCVFFRRGDLWRGNVSCAQGVTYSAYGEGEKPRFYGSPENGAVPEYWTRVDGTENVWKYHLAMRDVGGIVLNEGEKVAEKLAPDLSGGVFLLPENGKAFEFSDGFAEDLTFLSDIRVTNVADKNTLGYIYMRCDGGNPGELYDSIEFITAGDCFYVPYADTVVDNICTRYAQGGIDGSRLVLNMTVQNCEVGYIGGVLQGYGVLGNPVNHPTRYGNGINFYGACDGFTVVNNYVHDVYDAGISNQYAKGGTNEIRNDNIVYAGNMVERCCYGIEYFMGAADNYAIRIMTNLDIHDNIIRDSGLGFGRTNPTGAAAIKGWDHNNHAENFRIHDNIFSVSFGGLFHIGAAFSDWLPVISGNEYIQTAGASFGSYGSNPSKVYPYDFGSDEELRQNVDGEGLYRYIHPAP